MEPAEINPRANASVRRFTQFNHEWTLILLVAICVIVTVGNYFRTNAVIDAMADIKAGYEVNIREMHKDIERLNDQNEVTQIYLRDFKAEQKLKKDD